ncbi:Quinone oxidoreductase PIG3 [Grifola frondosa]|uniref:Quinone oxidoreductase PIG3 n=1 Tax=Grifola frondosa TaxID=5627 RepID=A0A1C7M8U0_GRIFR|nr:Quinone oxidoreductase PIG3 [Grifola frondosa]
MPAAGKSILRKIKLVSARHGTNARYSQALPGPGQVLVKIKAFGLNRMDIMQREGRYALPPGASPILGVEFSGHVAEVGEGVTEWKEGDEVLGLAAGGAYAEYIVAPHKNLLRRPANLSWEEAAGIPENFLTAFQALVVLAEVKNGDDVLIHAGASGVGIAAIQLARLYGANTVTATASTAEKLEWLLAQPQGATHAVNYKTQDFAAEVKRTTHGRGVDVIIDFVGQSHWHKNIDALAVDGRMTMLALLSGAEVASADLIARFGREVLGSITGCGGAGPLKVFIHKVYPWKEIQDAHREMEANKNSGKIIAVVG